MSSGKVDLHTVVCPRCHKGFSRISDLRRHKCIDFYGKTFYDFVCVPTEEVACLFRRKQYRRRRMRRRGVCVCVCVRARACACVRARVCVCVAGRISTALGLTCAEFV